MIDHAAWVEREFDRCWPWLEAAIRKQRETYGRDFVWGQMANKKAQIWSSPKAVIMTETARQQNGELILVGWLMGGDFEELKRLESVACSWGKSVGCTKAQNIQRPGLLKRPIGNGYRLKAVIVEKDL
jgi:hypothetical protein